jgi:hypothetical protein
LKNKKFLKEVIPIKSAGFGIIMDCNNEHPGKQFISLHIIKFGFVMFDNDEFSEKTTFFNEYCWI